MLQQLSAQRMQVLADHGPHLRLNLPVRLPEPPLVPDQLHSGAMGGHVEQQERDENGESAAVEGREGAALRADCQGRAGQRARAAPRTIGPLCIRAIPFSRGPL